MRLTSPDGQAVGRRTADGIDAEGWRWSRRSVHLEPLPTGWAPGVAQGFIEQPPEPWWTRVHVRDGAVLGALTPTQARLGVACCTALLGLTARGELRLVRVDRLRWAIRGSRRREAVDRAAGGVAVHRVGSGRAAGLEGVLLREDAGDWRGRVAAARQADPGGVPDGWLRLASAAADPAAAAWWRDLVEAQPELSARMVQDALIGAGVWSARQG